MISRRDFLKTASALAGVIGLKASGLLELQQTLAASGSPPVIWLQGQSCSGCSVSFLNSVHYATADDLLFNSIDLQYHPTIMAAAGDFAVSAAGLVRPSLREFGVMASEWQTCGDNLKYDLNGDGAVDLDDLKQLSEQKRILSRKGYILVVEGAIPTDAHGAYCEIAEGLTMIDALDIFADGADLIIAAGTCAAFGGVPAGNPNPTGAKSVKDALAWLGKSNSVVNIAGCPIHPDWLVGTLVSVLTNQPVDLDDRGRPLAYFAEKIHDDDNCPFKKEPKVFRLGQKGCLKELGCKGPDTKSDCFSRKWNSPAKGQNGVNWCIGAASPCVGCTEREFPDGKFAGFYTIYGLARNDGITVWTAKYKPEDTKLTVRATCDNQPDETLTLQGFGTMTWKSEKDYYEYVSASVASPPASVTITSSSGGTVTCPLG